MSAATQRLAPGQGSKRVSPAAGGLVPESVTSKVLTILCRMCRQVEEGKKQTNNCVTLAAEKASTPKHSEKRRVCMSTVLTRMEFIGEKSEHRQIGKNQYVSPAETGGR